jgi:hypothetical protein
MPGAVAPAAGHGSRLHPFAGQATGFFHSSPRGAPQVHVLGELASAGVISIVASQAVRLMRIVLDYRIKCKKIELRREQLGLGPGSQPATKATARHAARRRKRK